MRDIWTVKAWRWQREYEATFDSFRAAEKHMWDGYLAGDFHPLGILAPDGTWQPWEKR